METVRILVVDDDQQIRGMLAGALNLEGYVVETVADGRAALDALELSTFDLLVTDLAMPVLTGWDVVPILHERGSRLPIVV